MKKENEENIHLNTWKLVPECSSYYVSVNGIVISYHKGYPMVLSQTLNKHGYYVVGVVDDCRNKINKTVHRIVASAFIPNPDNKPCVNHKNGNKIDNKVSNLEWVTESENQKHRYEVLNHTAPNRLLTKDQVFDILRKEESMKDQSVKHCVSLACIKAVRAGRNYVSWYNEYNTTATQ